MIEVSGLVKRYGPTVAVDGVGFAVEPGEVVGLLGPNGAGKTTILRILTGYIPPSEGTAKLSGFDVQEQSLEVRRRIGYLPEANPLYEDMAVFESLRWTARLRGMEAGRAEGPIRQAVKDCGLGEAIGKEVSQLSKGYRQRLGLAQAMLHDPEILILDEPTSGLDPNQQVEVRELILQLKRRKTVLLSTHILSEARSVCDRVLIINKGKIVADGTPDGLSRELSGGRRIFLELRGPASALEVLSKIPGVERSSLERSEGTSSRFVLETTSGTDAREDVFKTAVSNGWPILEMRQEGATLEDVFRQLTTEERPVASS